MARLFLGGSRLGEMRAGRWGWRKGCSEWAGVIGLARLFSEQTLEFFGLSKDKFLQGRRYNFAYL